MYYTIRLTYTGFGSFSGCNSADSILPVEKRNRKRRENYGTSFFPDSRLGQGAFKRVGGILRSDHVSVSVYKLFD